MPADLADAAISAHYPDSNDPIYPLLDKSTQDDRRRIIRRALDAGYLSPAGAAAIANEYGVWLFINEEQLATAIA
jgi:hypothetical protein